MIAIFIFTRGTLVEDADKWAAILGNSSSNPDEVISLTH